MVLLLIVLLAVAAVLVLGLCRAAALADAGLAETPSQLDVARMSTGR